MKHRSSKDLWIHSKDLESIIPPLRVECVDGVLQVMVPGAVPTGQHLPSSVYPCLSTSRTRGGTSMLADHLLSIEDLQCIGKLHAPWPGNTLDHVLWDPGDAQLEQQTAKLHRNSR
jgi:hypothetical protein